MFKSETIEVSMKLIDSTNNVNVYLNNADIGFTHFNNLFIC